MTMGSPTSNIRDVPYTLFKQILEENDTVLAFFYIPLLEDINKKSLAEIEKVTQESHGQVGAFVSHDIRSEEHREDGLRFIGLPSIRLFRGLDNRQEYEGPHRAADISFWLRKQTLPPVSEIGGEDSLQAFKSRGAVTAVAFVAEKDESFRERFTAVAKDVDNAIFGITTDKALADTENVLAPSLILYKDFDEQRIVFDLKSETPKLANLLSMASTPHVRELFRELYFSTVKAHIPIGYILAKEPEERARLRQSLAPLGKKYKDKLILGTVDPESWDMEILERLQIDHANMPAFTIQNTFKGLFYPLEQGQDISDEVLDPFIQEVLEGKRKIPMKSQPIPESQGVVTAIVGDTYDEIVYNNDKDVFVDYYTTWCGPCKDSVPALEELGGLITANPAFSERITIGNIDAEANANVPSSIRKYPTFLLYPAGAKDSPVEFWGDRTVEGFAEFIRHNGTHKVDVLGEADSKSVGT